MNLHTRFLGALQTLQIKLQVSHAHRQIFFIDKHFIPIPIFHPGVFALTKTSLELTPLYGQLMDIQNSLTTLQTSTPPSNQVTSSNSNVPPSSVSSQVSSASLSVPPPADMSHTQPLHLAPTHISSLRGEYRKKEYLFSYVYLKRAARFLQCRVLILSFLCLVSWPSMTLVDP